MDSDAASRIRADVRELCTPGDRAPGTGRNRAATAFVGRRMREAGLDVEQLPFEVPEWRPGGAAVRVADETVAAHPGPFSSAFDGEGPLVVVRTARELSDVDAPAPVLLVCGELASEPLTPRDYPFYSVAEHRRILELIEAARPAAVLAATGKHPMAGALSPFPLIEEVGFAAPTAYLSVDDGERLAARAGASAHVTIDSQVIASHGTQPIARRPGTGPGRLLVSAHIDSRPGTPGAIDNAAGVAVMLAVADLLRGDAPRRSVEFVPFNGEDHVLAPGEMAYLASCGDLGDVLLAINIDAAGLPGAPSAYSLYNADEATTALVARLANEHPAVAEGPQWPASDHMIFAMRGLPAMALTSTDFATASHVYSHTAADTPDILDYEVLADAARFIAAVVREM